MSEPRESPRPSKTEQILDLLLDALLERQAARQAQGRAAPPPAAPLSVAPRASAPPSAARPVAQAQTARTAAPPASGARPAQGPRPGEPGWVPPPPRPSIHLDQALRRLLLILGVLVVLVNVPLNRSGASLARMIPPTASLVIRDGLVLKGSGPEIYVLQDNKLRWITSLDAFQFFGYRWEQVHVVDDSFLAQFEKGRPIHLLLKCESSPHIYALENDRKRWIKDIPTFEAQGYVWSDVKIVGCDYLRSLPDGPPIPEDAGPPPQP